MQVRSFHVPRQGQLAYLVESEGVAAVVDPDIDVTPYLKAMSETGASLNYVFLTHAHEDFVSGYRELAETTGAAIRGAIGTPIEESDELALGQLRFSALKTPGHAPEAVCLRLQGPNPEETVLFTGDTLLIGDAGRVDHLGDGAEDRARELYASITRLCDEIPATARVCPGHTHGTLVCRQPGPPGPAPLSECVANLRGIARRDEAEFMRWILERQPEVPRYFAGARRFNLEGAPPAGVKTLSALDAGAFAARVASGAPVLDARLTPAYNTGHIQGAIHVGPDGQFELWAGATLPESGPVAVVAPEGDWPGLWIRLARVGRAEGAVGLQGGMEAWRAAGNPVATAGEMSVEAVFEAMRHDARWQLVDVRRLPEWEQFHAPAALFIPMQDVEARAGELDPSRPLALVCRSGYRSSIASSLLERRGFTELYNVAGGMVAWKAAGLPVETG